MCVSRLIGDTLNQFCYWDLAKGLEFKSKTLTPGFEIKTELSMGPFFCDPIQPNLSADWPNLTQTTTSGKRWTQPDPTQIYCQHLVWNLLQSKMSLSNSTQQEITDSSV